MMKRWLVTAVLLLFLLTGSDSEGVTIRWETNKFIIGSTVNLTCQLDVSLSWNAATQRSILGPPGLQDLILNGVSSNTTKYEECTDSANKQFRILIKNFDYSDLGDYKCTYSFDNSPTLTVALDTVELQDPPSSVTKRENLEPDGTMLKYTLYEVRPQPNITVTVNGNVPSYSQMTIKERMVLNMDNNNYTHDAEFTITSSSLKGNDKVNVLIQAGEYTYSRNLVIKTPDNFKVWIIFVSSASYIVGISLFAGFSKSCSSIKVFKIYWAYLIAVQVGCVTTVLLMILLPDNKYYGPLRLAWIILVAVLFCIATVVEVLLCCKCCTINKKGRLEICKDRTDTGNDVQMAPFVTQT